VGGGAGVGTRLQLPMKSRHEMNVSGGEVHAVWIQVVWGLYCCTTFKYSS